MLVSAVYQCNDNGSNGISIDKSSSAELSEAINSMFAWYQTSTVCYAYLSDVQYFKNDLRSNVISSILQNSQWFSRGSQSPLYATGALLMARRVLSFMIYTYEASHLYIIEHRSI
jgi:hypothetical protein